MMRRKLRYIAVAGLLVLALAGCNEFEVETEVSEDGGGLRNVVFTMDPDHEDITLIGEEEYARHFGIEPGGAWQLESRGEEEEVEGKGHRMRFRFKKRIKGVDDWSELDGSITVRATLIDNGYSGVAFTNYVSLETGRIPGGSSYTYRESFEWNGLIEMVVDFQSDAYSRRMKKGYPHLGDEALAELKGLMAGHLLVGIRFLDLWSDGDENLAGIALSVGRRAEAIVRAAGKKADIEHVYEIARIYVGDEEKELEKFLEASMPGIVLAGLTDIKIRLVLPGRVVDTNGKVMEDGSVAWKMDLLEAIGKKVVFHARSESDGS